MGVAAVGSRCRVGRVLTRHGGFDISPVVDLRAGHFSTAVVVDRSAHVEYHGYNGDIAHR